MEWWMIIVLFFVLLMVFIFMGFSVAFSFLTVNIIVTTLVVGNFKAGMSNLVYSGFESLSQFSLTPIPLFILMGAVLFHSGIVMKILDILSGWLGKIPSRLSLLAIGTGTLFSALNGSAAANAAMLGSVLTPEMQKRGYHPKMIVGPILASGSLAMIIPPSAMTILLGSLARISVGDLLIAGIIPGLFLASLILLYYLILGVVNPDLAPMYHVEKESLKKRIQSLIIYILPITILLVIVLGVIFIGYATPTESSAIGAVGALLLALLYRRLNRKVLIDSIIETVRTSGMVLLIIAVSAGFSQLLAFSGATRELVNFVISMNVAPILMIIVMLVIVLLLGTFIEPISIMMITIPLYIPVVTALEYDLIWFGILMLICLGLGNITPPFGILLFIMRGITTGKMTMKEIYSSVIGVISIKIVALLIMIAIPEIITWLPSI